MKRAYGLVLAAGIALASTGLNYLYPPVSAVLIAVALGYVLQNYAMSHGDYSPGADYAHKTLLKLAIILMGARLSFGDIWQIGFRTVFIIIICICVSLALTLLMGRKLGVPKRLRVLIAAGTAICGNSAVVATAGAIDAEDEEVAFAVGTITLFGVLAIIVYPLVGSLLGLADASFGTWAGTGINDTAQVVTAGFIYSDKAGQVATVVKLTRNLFILPVVFLFSLLFSANREQGKGRVDYLGLFPLFILGFIAMALLRTFSLLPASLVEICKEASGFFVLMAVAGIGLTVNFGSMRRLGLKCLYMGLFASGIMGALSYLLIYMLL